MRRAGVLCVVLLCGCAPAPVEPPAPKSSPAASVPEHLPWLWTQAALALPWSCYKPLNYFCRGTECQTYSESATEARDYGASGCVMAAVGTCGDLRFVQVGDGFVSETEYFSATGHLVAARRTTDVFLRGQECPNWRHFGNRLSCVEVITTDYCEATRPR